MSSSVDALVIEASEGKLLSFACLYRAYIPLVRATLSKLCQPEEVDDLVQETFLRVWRGLPRFRKRGSLSPWIRRIAYHCSVNGLRARVKVVREVKSEEPREQLLEQDLEKVISELSVSHQQVLRLHCLAGKSIRQIAAELSVPEGTVKSRLHHARGRLRELL